MKKYDLPVIQEPMPEPKWFSMDDYLKFVYLHLEYTFDRKARERWVKMREVNIPFSIKD